MLPLQFSAAPKLFPSFDDYCKILHYQQSMLLGGLHSDQIMFKNLTSAPRKYLELNKVNGKDFSIKGVFC